MWSDGVRDTSWPGDLTRKVQTTNGLVFATRYSYDSAGRLTATAYPDGAVLDAVYDGNGQVAELGVTPNGGSRQIVLSGVTYAPFGPATGWQYGNGRILLRNLNRNYQPETIHDDAPGGLSLRYGFDAAGNLTMLKQVDQNATLAQYGYDGLNRLTQVMDGPTGTPIETYAYDATGNRTALTNAGSTTAYDYPIDSHRLASVGGLNRTYDAAGNTLKIGDNARQFAYDNSGRMTQVKAGGIVMRQYDYNAKGEQTRSYLDADNAYFVYDEAGRLLGEYDASGNPKQQILWFGDLPVGVLQGSGASQHLHYIEPDHLGTPRVIIDGTRNVAIWEWTLTGEAFGATPPNRDPDQDGVNFTFDLRFPGQRYDSAKGLNYNYFRDGYEPATGRYTQSDPIGLEGGLSTFAYVSSNPLRYTDQLGLAKWAGTSSSTGISYWKTGNFIDFYSLSAECQNGWKATAYVMATGFSAGVGSPISMAGSYSDTFYDSNQSPDPDVFNGPYAKLSGPSLSFGIGGSLFQKVSIGGAWSSLGAGASSSSGPQKIGGFDFNIWSVGVGQAVVLQKSRKPCECGDFK